MQRGRRKRKNRSGGRAQGNGAQTWTKLERGRAPAGST